LLIELVRVALLHEQNEIGIVGLLNDASEVHRVVNLVFGLQHLFKTKVVVTFLQSVKGYVFVVAREDIFVFAAGGCRVSKDRVMSLGNLIVRMGDDSSLRRINAEVVVKAKLVVPICAVSHFIQAFRLSVCNKKYCFFATFLPPK